MKKYLKPRQYKRISQWLRAYQRKYGTNNLSYLPNIGVNYWGHWLELRDRGLIRTTFHGPNTMGAYSFYIN